MGKTNKSSKIKMPENGNLFLSNSQKIDNLYDFSVKPRDNMIFYPPPNYILPKTNYSNADKYKNEYNIVKEYENFNYKIILDHDGAKLLQLYKEIVPNNNDFILFLELNDNYNIDSVLRIKVGTDVEHKKESLFKIFVNNINGKEVRLNTAAVNDLLGSLSEPGFIAKLYTASKKWIIDNILGFEILEAIGDITQEVIIPCIDFFHIEDNRWVLKDNKIKNPILPIDNLLKIATKDKVKFIDELILNSRSFLLSKTGDLRKDINIKLKNNKVLLEKVKLYESVSNVVFRTNKILDHVDEKLEELGMTIKNCYFTFIGSLDVFLKIINAYICGLWNSIIDLVKGIFELLLILNKASLSIMKGKESISYYAALSRELVENIRELYFKTPLADMVTITFSQAKKMLKTVLYNYKTNNLKISLDQIVRITYFCGYFIGFIIAIIIEIIYTGGTLTIADVVSRGSRLFSKVGAKIRRAAELVKDGVKKGAEIIKSIVKWIGDLLNIVKKDVKQLINKFIDFLKKLWEAIVKELKFVKEKRYNGVLITKVTYGESELSKLAILFRKRLGKNAKHSGNIAVFEYLDKSNKLLRKEITTLSKEELIELGLKKSPHAEILGMDWLEKNKIPADRVRRIYSELEPCSLQESKCKDKLTNIFKNAEIEYSFGYPGTDKVTPELRKKAIADRAVELSKLIK